MADYSFRARAVLLGTALVPVLLACVYFVNPFGARSLDPRQRILAHGVYRIPAASMAPTLTAGQIVFTRVVDARHDALRRGDIVTFLVPEHEGQVWMKRIVGLPGETIAIHEGRVMIDGAPLVEPYVAPGNMLTDYSLAMAPKRIPADRYFVLGDNRDNSVDSRMLTLTSRADITGVLVNRGNR